MKNKLVKSKNKVEKPDRHYSKDGKFCVYEIFPKSQKTIYHLRSGQSNYLKELTLDGYIGLPSGLYLNRDGYGFGRKGSFLLSQIREHISGPKKLELVISKVKAKNIKISAAKVVITFPYLDVKQLISAFKKINEENNNELRETADSFLSTKFPKKVTVSTGDFGNYKAGEINYVLSKKNVADKMDAEDLKALSDLYPKIFQSSTKKVRIKAQREALLQKSKNTTDKLYLDQVIAEFEKNLLKPKLKEEAWQQFLKAKVLRFLSNYVTSIEKENISVTVSYPDFVMVDVYGFIDIFEIKMHSTPLLALDESHDNYFWKTDVVKAISQIENYIDEIVKNSDEYIRKIKHKKGLDIKVVKPRGYIIAGTRSQFKNPKEFSDFRKLGSSLKNVDFILYDQLLENLKNLRSKL